MSAVAEAVANELDLTLPQADMFQCEAKYPLFVGGFGSGKTETLILNAINDLVSYPGADIGLYSPTYDLMRLNLMPRMELYLRSMFPRIHVNRSHFIIRIPGYGRMIFRSLDNPTRIIAYEVFRSHVDEIDTLPFRKAEDVWNKIIARNRQKVKGAVRANRVSAYSTPEGFRFTYDRWEKNQVEGYQYIRAPTYSNPHLPEDYVDSLRTTYSDSLIDAYIEGIWVNLTQGAVFPDFDRELNNCETVVDNEKNVLIVGQDFNITKQASVIYRRMNNNKELHAVDEISKAFDTPATIKILQERYPKNKIIVMPDATGKNRSTHDGSVSDFTLFRDAHYKVDAPSDNPPVRDRLNAANAMILNGKGVRTLKVNTEKCPEYTASLEQITFKDNGDMDKDHDLDHPIDAGTYPIHRLHPIERRKITVQTIVGGF